MSASDSEDAATVVDRPRSGADSARSSGPAPRRLPTSATAEETLRQTEADRMRLVGMMFIPILLGAIATVWFLVDGHPVVEWVYIGALLSWVVPFFWLISASVDGDSLGESSLLWPWIWIALIVAANQVYWGALSAGSVVSVVALTVIGPSHSFAAALASYVIAALGQLFPAVAMIAGYPDLGVLPADHLSRPVLILVTILLQGMFFLCFAFGRLTRRSMLRRTEEHHQAMRRLGRREAVLAEARADFERALGRGGAGAFTEQTLGHFHLGPVIGRGAMGEVYDARDDKGESAAIKVLHRSLLSNPDTTRRFMREIELASRIKHDNVVRVLEVGFGDAPVPYIAMERLTGESLADYLRRELRMSLDRAEDLVRQASLGLGAAHALDIIHRDVKPQNLFLDRDREGTPRWKVLDFGVGKLLGSGDSLTNDRLVGTPQYMAPEQASSKPVDVRADVYGLAAVAYRVLTGHPPFTAEDLSVVVFQVVTEMPVRPRLLATLDQPIEDVLRVGLAKEPGDRFATVAELAEALSHAAAGRLDPEVTARANTLTAREPWRGSQ